jgi:hypothetical protein
MTWKPVFSFPYSFKKHSPPLLHLYSISHEWMDLGNWRKPCAPVDYMVQKCGWRSSPNTTELGRWVFLGFVSNSCWPPSSIGVWYLPPPAGMNLCPIHPLGWMGGRGGLSGRTPTGHIRPAALS